MADEPKPWRWVGYNFGGDAFWDMRKDALQGRLVDADGNTILWATTTDGEDPRVEVASEEIARAIEIAGQAFKTIAEFGPMTADEVDEIEDALRLPGRIQGSVTIEGAWVQDDQSPLTDDGLERTLLLARQNPPQGWATEQVERLVAEVRRLRALVKARGGDVDIEAMRRAVQSVKDFGDALGKVDPEKLKP